MTSADRIVRGGMVVDGTGRPPFRADVAVSEGRIVDIGDLAGAEDVEILDAGGLVVAPGFIDIHSHSDFTLLVDPRAVSSIAWARSGASRGRRPSTVPMTSSSRRSTSSTGPW